MGRPAGTLVTIYSKIDAYATRVYFNASTPRMNGNGEVTIVAIIDALLTVLIAVLRCIDRCVTHALIATFIVILIVESLISPSPV
jgi:hypothetical protein